jgi:CHAT domain-containing protein/tetratricopeptide (TPR) repeat protein
MHYRLKSLSLATATLLLSLTSPLLPLTLKCEPLVVQAQTAQEQKLQADGLLGQGFNQLNDSQYQAAIQSLQEALKIYRQLGNRHKEATSLYGLGWAYDDLGQLGRAIESYQASLVIAREIGDRWLEATDLNLLGYAYLQLGQYRQALQFNQQSLVIARERGDPFKEALALADLGLVYFSLNEYERAIKFANQALTIADSRGFRLVQAYVLNDLGKVYRAMGQPQKAPKFHQQSITIAQNIGKRYWEAIAFNDLGIAYEAIGEYQQAMESYQQALTISHDIGFLAGEGKALSDIGSLLAQQNQPELAIVFYKQSVNAREAIRRNIQGLPWEARESYTKTVADTYRALADLLLKQDRVLEAQRVLDLLKVQELEDYLRNVRGNNNTAQGLPNLPPEEQTWTSYQAILNKAMEIGKELTQLRQIKPENRTAEQEQRIAQLVNVQQKIVEDFNNFTESPEVSALVQQLNPKARKADLVNNLDELIGLQDNLKNLQQKAVLLYPLILDDRIELILTTPDSPPIRRTVSVPKKQLNETIAAFRSALQDRTSDAKTPAQQLYNWLIKPLEADLKAADAQTIIYAPDAQLRYIPLAALYDGQQWLVQRYRINNITAASLTDLNTKPQSQLQVLAGAFATGRYSFTVGEQSFDFSGLPFAGTEVENLAKTVPTTTKLIDTAFTPQVTVPKMDDYTVVHLATHAAFVMGTPDDSFILFGNGERITLRDIQTWSLKNVDLVVLSACETGLGGKLGNGEEILGLGYQMQRAGARAAIASLWTVDDGGTQVLMNAFYANLNKSDTTKAEALRQAQIALITGDSTALGKDRGLGVEERDRPKGGSEANRTDVLSQAANRLSHPYYWAPFILIGNGL